jgi:hypothetical protein
MVHSKCPKIKVSSPGDRWRLPMIWQNTDHLKMEMIKDPRVNDENKESEVSDTTSATQEPLDLGPPDDPSPLR